MPRIRPSFAERRRRALRSLTGNTLEKLEPRNAATPLGASSLGLETLGVIHASNKGGG